MKLLVRLLQKKTNKSSFFQEITKIEESGIRRVLYIELNDGSKVEFNLIKREIIKITNVNAEPISMILVGEKDQNPHERPRKELEDVIIK